METYHLVDRHAWDDRHGGYFERCRPDWTTSSASKVLYVQLDMLEGIEALVQATAEREPATRGARLVDLIVEKTRDPRHGCFLDHFAQDWRYDPRPRRDVLQLGLNLKTGWLLPRAGVLLGCQDGLLAAAQGAMEFCLAHGWDRRHGGFFHHLSRNGSIAGTRKHWWPLCDGILGLLTLFRETGDDRYARFAGELQRFALTHLVDPQFGEWYTACRRDGLPVDRRKGHDWKAAYHTPNSARTCPH